MVNRSCEFAILQIKTSSKEKQEHWMDQNAGTLVIDFGKRIQNMFLALSSELTESSLEVERRITTESTSYCPNICHRHRQPFHHQNNQKFLPLSRPTASSTDHPGRRWTPFGLIDFNALDHACSDSRIFLDNPQ